MKWALWIGLAIVLAIAVMVAIGAMLPRAHIATRRVILKASPEAVFALIAGPSDWRGLKYERLGDSPLKWRETQGNDAIVYERVETVAPTRIVNRIADPGLPFGGSWTYDVAPEGTGSALTITENGEVYNPLFRFVSRFVMGHTATIDQYVVDLRKRLGE